MEPCCFKQVLSHLKVAVSIACASLKSPECEQQASTHIQRPVRFGRRWRKPSRGFSYREVFLGAASTFTLGLVLGWLRRTWLISLFGRFQQHRVVRVTPLQDHTLTSARPSALACLASVPIIRHTGSRRCGLGVKLPSSTCTPLTLGCLQLAHRHGFLRPLCVRCVAQHRHLSAKYNAM